MVSKIFTRIAGLVVAAVAGALLLLAGGLGTAHAAVPATTAAQQSSTSSAVSTPPKNQGSAGVSPTSETRAVVVGAVAFVLMLGAAGAVIWHTARTRHTPH